MKTLVTTSNNQLTEFNHVENVSVTPTMIILVNKSGDPIALFPTHAVVAVVMPEKDQESSGIITASNVIPFPGPGKQIH